MLHNVLLFIYYSSGYEKKLGWVLIQLWKSICPEQHTTHSLPSPQLHNELVYSPSIHSPSPPELLPQLLLRGEWVIEVLFHKGDISRNDSLGTALHKLKHLLLGWRVKVIKKNTPDAPALPTMDYVEVVVTPGKQSKAKSGVRGKQQRHASPCECFHSAPSLTKASRVLTLCPTMKMNKGLSRDLLS